MSTEHASPSDFRFHVTYGDRLRRVRLDQGETQVQFSERIGVEPTLLGRHEKLNRPPLRGRSLLANSVQLAIGEDGLSHWILTGHEPGSGISR